MVVLLSALMTKVHLTCQHLAASTDSTIYTKSMRAANILLLVNMSNITITATNIGNVFDGHREFLHFVSCGETL